MEAEVAVLTSIDRIDREARGRLGMVPAGNTMTLEVHKQPPEQQLVPLRFLSTAKAPEITTSSWWQKLLGLLPFF